MVDSSQSVYIHFPSVGLYEKYGGDGNEEGDEGKSAPTGTFCFYIRLEISATNTMRETWKLP